MAGRLFSLCPAAQSLAAVGGGRGGAWRRDRRRTRAGSGRSRCFASAWAKCCGRACSIGRRDQRAGARRCDAPARRAQAAARRAAGQRGTGTGGALARQRRAALASIDAEGGAAFSRRQLAEARAERGRLGSAAGQARLSGRGGRPAVCEAMMARRGFFARAGLAGPLRRDGRRRPRAMPRTAASRRGWRARRADMAATLDAIGQLLAGRRRAGRFARGVERPAGAGLRGGRFRARKAVSSRCGSTAAGRIADYRIVAPTEWNFHPDGPFVRALARRAKSARARRPTADRAAGFRFRPLHPRRRRNSWTKDGVRAMHEMSLTESVVEILCEEARKQGFARVKTVWLEIGDLSRRRAGGDGILLRRGDARHARRRRASSKSSARRGRAGASIAKRRWRSPNASAPVPNAADIKCR